MKEKFDKDFDYHVTAYLFPEQFESINFSEYPDQNKMWIFKPEDGYGGEGIFVFATKNWKQTVLGDYQNSLLLKAEEEKSNDNQTKDNDLEVEAKIEDKEVKEPIPPAIICDYLDPLLVNGYKFDLRVYVLVTSFNPLKIYIYKEGIVRFATSKYNSNVDDCSKFAHLTNAAGNFYINIK